MFINIDEKLYFSLLSRYKKIDSEGIAFVDFVEDGLQYFLDETEYEVDDDN